MAGVALRLPGWTPRAAGEIEDRAVAVDGEGRDQRRAVVEQLPALVAPVGHPLEHRLDLPRRLPPQGVHVLEDVLEAHRLREAGQGLPAAEDGGQHGPQIGEVVGQGPGRIRAVLQEPLDPFPPRLALFQDQRRRDDDPLLGQRLRIRRHRTRPDAADLGVVGPAGHVAEQAVVEMDRRHQGHVRQMGAAEGRVVGDHHVARLEGPVGDQLADAETHRAEVDRDVGRVDHQPACGIEQGAREVLALLDIGRDRGPLQHLAHLAGDRSKSGGS